ncbi:MAG TPA: glycine--tRNA ligase subunit beta, partial [Campylobacterales bacterium]|nr:glycine--tRNA ligase subunit beta [Campylobacterales bacterium]
MINSEFLIEIGMEELPAIPFLKEAQNLAPKWESILQKNGFDSKFELFYTPRRITLYSKDFKRKANDEELELWGPPVAVAIKDGTPTKAYESFLSKNSLGADEVSTAQKDGKECLYAKKMIVGKTIDESLNDMVNEWLKSLHFGKSMRWGSLDESFIRPIRWIVALFGSSALSVEAYGVKSGEHSYGHRQESFEPIHILNTQDYFTKLASAGVMLLSYQRETKILDDIKAIEEKRGFEVEIDKELLAEVVAITEYPTALLGTFDEAFLKVPSEVIITSMKENQRYFPVFEGAQLSNHFVVVSNAFIESFDKVVAGNERVLKARLSDALFFYENDLKKGLSNDGLSNVVFVEGLGSVADKVEREVEIAAYL